jgi:hypothetical protein
MPTTFAAADILAGLWILVAVMIVIVLYHLLFIVVDLRKVMRRVSRVSEQVEGVILKPLAMADQAVEWMIDFLNGKKKHKRHHIEHIDD